MHIGVPLETHAGETRVAATPETIKKLVSQGHQVTVQSGAGVSASIPDSAYAAVGAIDFPTGFWRRDIGWRELERQASARQTP